MELRLNYVHTDIFASELSFIETKNLYSFLKCEENANISNLKMFHWIFRERMKIKLSKT